MPNRLNPNIYWKRESKISRKIKACKTLYITKIKSSYKLNKNIKKKINKKNLIKKRDFSREIKI